MPVNFDHEHYVPILKTKRGERWALQRIKNELAPDITPLLEIHPPGKNSTESHIEATLEALTSTWGTERPFFLDTLWLHEQNGNPAIIETVFDIAREKQLQCIPVTRLSYGETTLEQ